MYICTGNAAKQKNDIMKKVQENSGILIIVSAICLFVAIFSGAGMI